ncbi:FSH1-domain-containing protein [Guyanagaster necrorhizus]|uniref:FSH1-domain-containing protein n=1 Tax=Guyanagaster necrorhizus TaxID=856835 RepID=A0A9P7VLK1_9AGAR|nr:FSH1-domain-containing protein [Guyanagaster necrorhizus MCA 3950]KAG7442929.1 FSH1-domain-containing protein [Guyanagaster necrorhizus MCA 3950]
MATRSILVLHGYAQNASIFSKRLGALRKQCGKDIDLVFVDGPHILQPVDLQFNTASVVQSTESTLSAFGASEANNSEDPSLTLRGWYKANHDRTKAIGLEDSLVVLRDILKERKFDGVLGFSQGAALAAFLSALLEKPEAYPRFLIDGEAPHPPLQFCISVAGFKIADPLSDIVYNPTYATPTLHVLGRTDIIVTEERANGLLKVSANKRIEGHDGGHFVPSKTSWRKFLVAYLRDPLGNVPSPSNISSTPNSGTATPAATD